ncbi:MAG: hypothetical protein PHV11_01095 [Candidatus Bipolaricaulis sp.]|nr:hypothetical protein [Candidatus Bipolaricaulis sp.]
MRSALLTLIGAVLLGGTAAASPAAALGSSFADAYAAFAPLYEFYRGYADHLFVGLPVNAPPLLDSACDAFPAALETLHFALITQTESAVTATLGYLVRLRGEAAAFCAAFGDGLRSTTATQEVDVDTLTVWSDAGLFVSIYGMNRSFESTLDAALAAAGDARAPWDLAVAFALRGLLVSPGVARVSPEIVSILYGSEEATAAPFAVPDDVAAALATLVAHAGKPLEADGQAEVLAAAQLVYAYVMSGE